jgi:hypothetical protein
MIKITEAQAYDMYNDFIDEGGPVIVHGMEFEASRALKALDPIAYRVGFSDYTDLLEQDGYEIAGY